jgi:hypothetical protein
MAGMVEWVRDWWCELGWHVDLEHVSLFTLKCAHCKGLIDIRREEAEIK